MLCPSHLSHHRMQHILQNTSIILKLHVLVESILRFREKFLKLVELKRVHIYGETCHFNRKSTIDLSSLKYLKVTTGLNFA